MAKKKETKAISACPRDRKVVVVSKRIDLVKLTQGETANVNK